MKKDITIEDITFCLVLGFVITIFILLFFSPLQSKTADNLFKQFRKFNSAQIIAPERLFVSVWRSARNEYIYPDMNHQDWQKWKLRYLGKIKTFDDAKIAIDSMLFSLNDPYTKFLTSSSFSKQKNILDSEVTVYIEKNGKLGTKVIEKKDIPIDTMNYDLKSDDKAVISIINIMGKKAIDDFKKLIENTNEKKVLIIDLRNNYGGKLSNAIEMVNFMLDDEKIIDIILPGNKKLNLYANNDNIFKNKAIIILINKKTASAAELLAGSLKYNHNAVLIGENTYGKNSIQKIIPLHNKTGLMITGAKYILPSDVDISDKGIEPDIYIADKKNADDEVMNKALKLADEIVKNEK